MKYNEKRENTDNICHFSLLCYVMFCSASLSRTYKIIALKHTVLSANAQSHSDKHAHQSRSAYPIIDTAGLARVAPISDSVIGGMLASKCAITQANRTYILNDRYLHFLVCSNPSSRDCLGSRPVDQQHSASIKWYTIS